MSRRIKNSYQKTDNTARAYKTNKDPNIIDMNSLRKPTKQKVVLLPKNLAQENYIEALEDFNTDIVFAVGPAGTGKTMLATAAAIQMLNDGDVDRIVITRPAISVDEQHGFLPGTLIEKMQPWVLPILDYFYEYFCKKDVLSMMENGVIDISPLAYMRGRTYKNSFIIADEFQNSTPNQMKMLLTRIGENSKIVVTGDIAQHDRGFEQNGLKDFIDRFKSHNKIEVCYFSSTDVERHPIITDILKLYGEE